MTKGQGPGFPPVIIGAWQLSVGHHSSADRDPLDALLELAELHRGRDVVVFDCADIYTGVEESLGRLRAMWPSRFPGGSVPPMRVHTKLVPDRSELARVDPDHVRRIVERSLRRLGVDRLDLVQFAWWDYDVPGYVECGQILEELRQEGLIAQIGATNFDTCRLRELLEAGVPVAAHQVQYSALDHRPEPDMVELCGEHDVALLCYGTLAGGFLTDRWLGKDDPAPGGLEAAIALPSRSMTKYRLIIDEFGGWESYQSLLRTLEAIARRHQRSIASVAMAYALGRPAVRSIIVGATSAERWRDALDADSLLLAPEEVNQIRSHAEAAPGPAGPVFGLERMTGGAHAAIMKYNLNAGKETLG